MERKALSRRENQQELGGQRLSTPAPGRKGRGEGKEHLSTIRRVENTRYEGTTQNC